ncbi:MAG: MarR family transcriptional regulator [Verrucomicrobia bacterium]|nr:MarR family transcriptional regulator [Kiritimatiellia bacterium]MCB1102089.1 MarR family transcriptional regulator [Kiritimatiellia bacterium]MCP5487178.1 MarR family transcriptional regulator [Verrucomicrobiota bacterium]
MNEVSLQEFAERVSSVMPVMCKSMMRYEENALTQGILSVPQFWAMSWLGKNPASSMHDLAQALKLKPSTATMLITRLTEMGLVERKHDTDDRRKVLVRLTRKGIKLLDEIGAQKKKALQETFRPLNPTERNQYLFLIETLAARLTEDLDGTAGNRTMTHDKEST